MSEILKGGEGDEAMVQAQAFVKGWDNEWHAIETERAAAKAASYALGGRRHAIKVEGSIMLIEFTISEINELQHLGRFERTASTGRFLIVAEMP